MRTFIAACLTLITFLLTGCTTSRCAKLTHDRLVEATVRAMVAEGYTKEAEVKRTDIEEKGGRLTTLIAPCIQYSKIIATVDSREKNAVHPELSVKVTTGDAFYTQHRQLEDRILELVALDLRARAHGAESQPTSLPPIPVPPPPPASEQPKPAAEKGPRP